MLLYQNLWKKRQQHCFVLPLAVHPYLKDGILYFHFIVTRTGPEMLSKRTKKKNDNVK